MPKLIQNITGTLASDIRTEIDAFGGIQTSFGYTDWFKIGNFEVFLQNYKKVTEVTEFNITKDFGLQFNRNKGFVNLNVSY